MSLDTDWPNGRGEPQRMRGRARDIVTFADDAAPQVLAEDELEIIASQQREILSIAACRENAAAQGLVGQRGGGHLRQQIAGRFPEEHRMTTPLHMLLDDFSGASLVAGWAWSRWTDDWKERMLENARANPKGGRMEGICAGFRPGSSSLFTDGTHNPANQSCTPVPPLPHPDDPLGWHRFTEQDGVGMRRARRIDVWFDDLMRIDVGFQDSATSPAGGRIGLHEYRVAATADAATGRLLSIEVDPRVLPYPECPAASPNARLLEGAPLGGFRLEVLDRLPGVLGCTHLNDVLRAMADVPRLVTQLSDALARPR